ncbi:MAG: 3-methyl-2-oxobutanoate hydroxymethyltransferase [Gemmataceae bacterium]
MSELQHAQQAGGRRERPVTVPDFAQAKATGRKLVMLTAYDFPFAKLLDSAGLDGILVGDSLGMVVQGHSNCLPVTLEEMIYHTRLVSRAVHHSLVVADMPFLSYQTGVRDAVLHAGMLVKQGGAHAVKIEGGQAYAPTVRALVEAEIPVMGHIGLTPQSYHRLGGFRVQRDLERLRADACALQEAGAFALVIECVPASIAAHITAQLTIPTIGIGAGSGCDGQILVVHDLLGLFPGFRPRFVKVYTDLGELIQRAVREYCDDVRAGRFPGPEHELS